MDYRLALDLEVLQFLFTLHGVNRGNVMRWLERLRNAPFSEGHSTILDSTGREIQVSTFSHFRIFHWSDHAVKTVQVVKMELNS